MSTLEVLHGTNHKKRHHEAMNRLKRKTEGGFTLIELLVVIAIIGILAAIAVPELASYRRRGYDTDVKSNLKNASISEEAYFTDHELYTPNLANLVSWGFKQSPNVTITLSSSPTTFVITGVSTAGCSPSTGIWSFASSTGVIAGAKCN